MYLSFLCVCVIVFFDPTRRNNASYHAGSQSLATNMSHSISPGIETLAIRWLSCRMLPKNYQQEQQWLRLVFLLEKISNNYQQQTNQRSPPRKMMPIQPGRNCKLRTVAPPTMHQRLGDIPSKTIKITSMMIDHGRLTGCSCKGLRPTTTMNKNTNHAGI